MEKIYLNVRGTSDFGVSQSLIFRDIIQKAQRVFKLFGYQEIILPLLEERGLFTRAIGQTTDIVEGQMFKIEGKDIVLRPEATAQVIRYYLQNSLYKQSNFYKFFYTGPMFRGERPQRGRLRQFYHLGAEAIGSDNIYLDAEIILLCLRILDDLGINERQLQINSLGCSLDKKKFSDYIKKVLNSKRGNLCNNCQKRLGKNPLRVLDCKQKQCQKILNSLGIGKHHLCQPCKDKFEKLLFLLKDLGLEYQWRPSLVRGLNYYTNTVFEITCSALGAQDAIGAGGRYNNLIKSLGGPDIAAVGFALGLERILLVLDRGRGGFGTHPYKQAIDVFVAVAGENLRKSGFKVLNDLRKVGLSCDYDYCGKSLKGQLRLAQKRNARYVVIVGQEEWKDKSLLLKDMAKGIQEKVKIEELVDKIRISKSEIPNKS